MMIKSKSAKGRRWRSLAMVPAVVAVLALTNLPGVASVLTEMGNASLSDGKGTQNSAEREIKRVPMDSFRNLPAESVDRIKIVDGEGSTNKIVAFPSDFGQPIMEATLTVHGPDSSYACHGRPAVFIDGTESSRDEMSKLETSRIKSVKIDKADKAYPNGAIYVELKKDGEKEDNRTLAQFKGGESEMYAWVTEHIRIPKVKDAPEKALVVVRFVIDETGKVGNAEILRGSIAEYNAEALRVVGEMPDFIPATENGKPIATQYALPIRFGLK